MKLRAGPSTHRLAFWALAAVSLLVSHDAIWLVQLGAGEDLAAALRSGGHGYWGVASVALGVSGLAGVTAVGRHLWHLRRAANRVASTTALRPRGASYLSRVSRAWAWLLVLVLIGFVLQENVEHTLTHGQAPGFGALLGPEHPLAIPVIAAITLIGALLASVVLVIEEALLAIIRGDDQRRRPPRRLLRPEPGLRRSAMSRPRAHTGRAPPGLLVPG